LTGNQELKSQGQIAQENVTVGQRAKNTLIKPFSLNFKEPVIFANNLFIVNDHLERSLLVRLND
jgi:hypothetical protein